MQCESIGVNIYFVSFIDDYIRTTYIYLIIEKFDVIEVFKKFKSTSFRQIGKFIKVRICVG